MAFQEVLESEVRASKKKNKHQREAQGLGTAKVALSADKRFWLYRHGGYAVVEDRLVKKEAQFRLDIREDGRARLDVEQLKKRMPEFHAHLIGYGLWDSLTGRRPRCLLYRISYVLRHKQNIHWLGHNTQRFEDYDDEYLAINHKDGDCENDHWTNLELLTYKQHGLVEVERTNRELEEAFETLFDTGVAAAS